VTGALLLHGGVVAHRLGNGPMVMPALTLEGRVSPRAPLWIAATAGVEATTVARATGTVDVRGLPATLGIGVEPLAAGPVAFFGRLDVGVAYTALAGGRVTPGLVAGKVEGLGFCGSAGAGVAVRLRALRLELTPRVGLVAGAPQGSVSGDRPVAVSGLWAGADLAAGVAF
jgi:hypothetical protein